MLGTVPPNVSGVNFVTETLNVSAVPVGLDSVIVTDVGWPMVTRPKLAETGPSHVVASAATDRFSRPVPCAVGPTSCKPVMASLTTRSARLTSADFTWVGNQSGWSCSNTAAEPAICGVDIDVPWKNAHPVPLSGQPAGLFTHVIELRTLTPTDVTSGLTAKSTFVGPWPLKPARMSLFSGVMNSWNVADAEASDGFAVLSAAPSFLLIMTAGRSSSKPAVLAIAIGSPATLFMITTPIAPAALAFATFWLKTHAPRSMIATLPEAPHGTLLQPLECVSNKLKDAAGNGSKSPTAAPMVVPPLAG